MQALPWVDTFDEDRRNQDGGWTVEHPQQGTVQVQGGMAVLLPNQETGWFQNRGNAPWAQRSVQGNFRVRTRLRVTNVSGEMLPEGNYSNAGLLLLNQRADPDAGVNASWLMLDMGRQDMGNPGTLWKSTVNGQTESRANLTDVEGWHEVAVCRRGTQFDACMHQPDGGWICNQSYVRPDLQNVATLDVGVTAGIYTTGSLRAEFDFVAFDQPPPSGPCSTGLRVCGP